MDAICLNGRVAMAIGSQAEKMLWFRVASVGSWGQIAWDVELV
ncbi:MAG: hypothetical protein ABI594_17185 [Ginsengibacter sp.]